MRRLWSHVSENLPKMVDVSAKHNSVRNAVAETQIKVPVTVMQMLESTQNEMHGPKGPVFATAIVAGVMAAKKTSEIIPFCHPIPIDDCQIVIKPDGDESITVRCSVKVTHKTGVEMEALTGASVAALCVYDMCKALSHDITIEKTRLVHKCGGKTDYIESSPFVAGT